MHAEFPITSTNDIIAKLPIGEDGEVIDQNTTKRIWVEVQYMSPYIVEDIEDSESEHKDDKQRHEYARTELSLIAQKAA